MDSVASLNVDISKFLDVAKCWIIPFSGIAKWNCCDFAPKMLEEGLHADVTLTATGGSVKAHKSVLACVSPVFRAMFEHDMKEHLTGTVDVPDMSIEALQLFLLMLYTTNEEGNESIREPCLGPHKLSLQMPHFSAAIDKHFDEVHQAVLKYQVHRRLGSVLISALARHLTPENCWYYCDSSLMSAPGPFTDGIDKVWSDFVLGNYGDVIESESFLEEMKSNPGRVYPVIRKAESQGAREEAQKRFLRIKRL